MIGQKQLIKQIDNLKDYPRFIIITGDRGSGKKTIAHYIAKKAGKIEWTLEDIKIANVRQMIEMSYNNYQSMVCIIPDVDEMSSPAQNALLKIVEEPPKNTYFIMTVQDINNVLATIKSRAFVLNMQPYTDKEILKYVQKQYNVDNKVYTELCSTPGEVDLLHDIGVDKFVDFVDKVVDNIGTVGTANAFKVGQSIKLTNNETDNGFDLKLFFKAFIRRCMQEEDAEYLRMVLITSDCLTKLAIKGVNKQFLFSTWLLKVREIWN